MTVEMILKIIALACCVIIGVAVLLTNKNNEDIARGTMIFMAVVVGIIFLPEIWKLLAIKLF